jgi:enoyl-CoA hydratase/carnithine racemase
MSATDSHAGPRTDRLRVEHPAEGCVLLRMNRLDAANAVDASMTAALQEALAWTEADARVRVVVLASAHPQVYCAGADLPTIAAGRVADLFPAEAGFAGFVRAARRKPWVAMVGGAALAGGFELALACDVIVASTAARFALPETRRGLAALAGGVQRLPLRVPASVALDLILSGEAIDGRRAFQAGLVSRLTEPAELEATCVALARRIAANAPGAVRDSLLAARTAIQLGEPAAWAVTPQLEQRRLQSEEFKEGARAFFERREPVWPEESSPAPTPSAGFS